MWTDREKDTDKKWQRGIKRGEGGEKEIEREREREREKRDGKSGGGRRITYTKLHSRHIYCRKQKRMNWYFYANILSAEHIKEAHKTNHHITYEIRVFVYDVNHKLWNLYVHTFHWHGGMMIRYIRSSLEKIKST